MSHAEYWQHTPHEITMQCRAYAAQQESSLQIAAWHVAHVINLVVSKNQSVTPMQLLGKSQSITPEQLPDIKRKAIMAALDMTDSPDE